MAEYPLVDIFNLIQNKNVTFLARSRSVDEVIKTFPNLDDSSAERYILSNLLKLVDSDYAGKNIQWNLLCDVYGKSFDGISWYIKFAIEKDENGADNLSEISFHPLEKDLKLCSGLTLRRSI